MLNAGKRLSSERKLNKPLNAAIENVSNAKLEEGLLEGSYYFSNPPPERASVGRGRLIEKIR